MPIIKSAIKRAKQSEKRKQNNIITKHLIKDAAKAFSAKPSFDRLSLTQSELDKAVKKGLIKKNTAARRKSKLFAIAKEAGTKLSASKKTSNNKPIKPETTKKPIAKTASTVKKAVVKKKPAIKKTTPKKIPK